jgi:hypothetical protein
VFVIKLDEEEKEKSLYFSLERVFIVSECQLVSLASVVMGTTLGG